MRKKLGKRSKAYQVIYNINGHKISNRIQQEKEGMHWEWKFYLFTIGSLLTELEGIQAEIFLSFCHNQ